MSEIQTQLTGFSYYVSAEQLAAFAKLTTFERLQWVDDARMFTLLTETPETKARHDALRAGKYANFHLI